MARLFLACGLIGIALGVTAARRRRSAHRDAVASGESARLPRSGRREQTRCDDRRLAPAEEGDRCRDAGRDGTAARSREALPARHEGRGRGRLRELCAPIHHLFVRAGFAGACLPADSQGRSLRGEGRKRVPAVLCLHATDNVVGNGVVVGLGSRPNRAYASELAERGYVTLAPNYPLLAKYQPDIKALGWESGTLKAVWDNMRGLDLLESLPFVKPGAFGAIGHSLGGHNSVYTAVFDERIKVVVTSCGLDSYLDYYGGDEKVWLPEKGWTQTRYMPRLAGYRGRLKEIPFDFHEMIGALAPRHVLIIAPLKDSNFRARERRPDRGLRATDLRALRPSGTAAGRTSRLRARLPERDARQVVRPDRLGSARRRQRPPGEEPTRRKPYHRPAGLTFETWTSRGRAGQRHEVVLRPAAREGRGRGASLRLGAKPTTPPDCSFASRPTPRPSRPGGLSSPAASPCRTCRPRASAGSTSM